MSSTPPLSRRGKILQNLQRQLRTIKATDGYSRDVYKVTTDVQSWQATPEAETPTIYVVDSATNYKYRAGRLTERMWTIDLYGVMRNQTQEDMEEFISDIEICLLKNSTLSFPETGKVAAHHRILDIKTDNQLFAQIESSQLFKITIEIIYSACLENIR